MTPIKVLKTWRHTSQLVMSESNEMIFCNKQEPEVDSVSLNGQHLKRWQSLSFRIVSLKTESVRFQDMLTASFLSQKTRQLQCQPADFQNLWTNLMLKRQRAPLLSSANVNLWVPVAAIESHRQPEHFHEHLDHTARADRLMIGLNLRRLNQT